MGEPVYRKVGFELVGKEEIGLEEFGGEGVHVHGEWYTFLLIVLILALYPYILIARVVAMVRSPKHLA